MWISSLALIHILSLSLSAFFFSLICFFLSLFSFFFSRDFSLRSFLSLMILNTLSPISIRQIQKEAFQQFRLSIMSFFSLSQLGILIIMVISFFVQCIFIVQGMSCMLYIFVQCTLKNA